MPLQGILQESACVLIRQNRIEEVGSDRRNGASSFSAADESEKTVDLEGVRHGEQFLELIDHQNAVEGHGALELRSFQYVSRAPVGCLGNRLGQGAQWLAPREHDSHLNALVAQPGNQVGPHGTRPPGTAGPGEDHDGGPKSRLDSLEEPSDQILAPEEVGSVVEEIDPVRRNTRSSRRRGL